MIHNIEKNSKFALGVDIKGKEFLTDLAELNSTLIVGNSGTGKTSKIKYLIKNIDSNVQNNETTIWNIKEDSEITALSKLDSVMVDITSLEDIFKSVDYFTEEVERRKKLLIENDVENYSALYTKALESRNTELLAKLSYRTLVVTESGYLFKNIYKNYTKDDIQKMIYKLREIIIYTRTLGIVVLWESQTGRDIQIPKPLMGCFRNTIIFDNPSSYKFLTSETKKNLLDIPKFYAIHRMFAIDNMILK